MAQQIPPSGSPGILLLRLIRLFYLEPLGETLIELKSLPLGMRILTVLGYLTVLFLLFGVLVIEILRPWTPLITYNPPGGTEMVETSVIAVILACLAFCLGWAYLLTGATDARKRIFLPVWGLFAVQVFFSAPWGNDAGMLIWCLAAPTVLFGFGGVYLFSRKWSGWSSKPILEFGLWLGIFALFFGLFALSSFGISHFVSNLNGVFSLLSVIAVPFWLFYGATIVDLGLKLASKVTIRLRRGLSPERLAALSGFIVFAHLGLDAILLGLLYFLAPDWMTIGEALAVDLGVAALVTLLAPIAALVKGWTPRVAAIFLTVTLSTPVFALSVVLSLFSQSAEALDVTLALFTRFTPLLVFVFLTAHAVLSIGASFANQEGVIIPRNGRVLIVFGLSLLVIAFTVFFVNGRDAYTGEFSNLIQGMSDGLFALGAFFLGIPYLLWTIWKHPDDLAGEEKDFPINENTPRPRRSILWIAALLGVLFSLLACGGILVLDQLMK